MRTITATLTLLLALPALSARTTAQAVQLERVASGISEPLFVTAPEGDERAFVVLRSGIVRILTDGGLLAGTFFMNISTQVSENGEGGLLGLAFHPDYQNNGWVFTNYTNNGGTTVVSRWTISSNPNRIDHASEVVILSIAQPFTNHNGGWIGFGPDGYLYIATGDGGSANDPGCHAQNPLDLLGKMLRLDVDSLPYSIPLDNPFVGTPGYAPEIWLLGLRNPWRASFDRETGDMYIADVGQDAREEVDFVAAGESGLNFGWKAEEGTACNSVAGCGGTAPSCGHAGYVDPIWEIAHAGSSARSITGGYVYRGCAIPSFQGRYIFSDYVDAKVRSFVYDPVGGVQNFLNISSQLIPAQGTRSNIGSLGEDGFGELYLCRTSNIGEVFKIVPAGGSDAVSLFENGGGTNTTCFSDTTEPVLGGVWKPVVDTSSFPGASFGGVVGYLGASGGLFFKGSEILVDLGSQKIFAIMKAPTNELVEYEVPLPCDISLDGAPLRTQGFVLDGKAHLCNAQYLTLGWF